MYPYPKERFDFVDVSRRLNKTIGSAPHFSPRTHPSTGNLYQGKIRVELYNEITLSAFVRERWLVAEECFPNSSTTT